MLDNYNFPLKVLSAPSQEAMKKAIENRMRDKEAAFSDFLVDEVGKVCCIQMSPIKLREALYNASEQYNRGYHDAKNEIIHCQDCIYWNKHNDKGILSGYCGTCNKLYTIVHETFYCGYAAEKLKE